MAVETGTYTNGRRNGKSAAAFRTISEVADDLDVPPHVLRFWETKFPQVRPLKRGGGRRYYRPEDVSLLKRIRELLYADGYTIKGVQRLLRDGSVKPVQVDNTEELPASPVDQAPASDSESESPNSGLSAGARSEITKVLDELVSLKKQLQQARG
jgi:DNA-binding transcriptional MerR regulator